MAKTTIAINIGYTLEAMINLPEDKEAKDIAYVDRTNANSIDVAFKDGTIYNFDNAMNDDPDEDIDGFSIVDWNNDWDDECFTDGVLKTPTEV